MLTRRSLLGVPLASCVGFIGKGKADDKRGPQLGFHLVDWDTSKNNDQRHWERAVIELHSLGIRRVNLVTCRYVDPKTGRLTRSSKHGFPLGPSNAVLTGTLQAAKALEIDAAIYPLLEIDQGREPGETWRGELTFDGSLQPFFSSYSTYIFEMTELARRHGCSRFYIGSELSRLTKNSAAIRHWTDLIEVVRSTVPSATSLLTYAAQHEEYLHVPFWSELDEIGINAYFPLTTSSEATGYGNPDQKLMQRRWRAVLERLEKFSRKHGKRISFSEWGAVPFDLTTALPWEEQPTLEADPVEQLNAYQAVLRATQETERWLSAIDFWHWKVPTSKGSPYAIDVFSRIAEEVVRRHLTDTR